GHGTAALREHTRPFVPGHVQDAGGRIWDQRLDIIGDTEPRRIVDRRMHVLGRDIADIVVVTLFGQRNRRLTEGAKRLQKGLAERRAAGGVPADAGYILVRLMQLLGCLEYLIDGLWTICYACRFEQI